MSDGSRALMMRPRLFVFLKMRPTPWRAGRFILFGETGVGKTSLARLFSGMFPETARHVLQYRGERRSVLWLPLSESILEEDFHVLTVSHEMV
jgi:ABC-type transport system involved in cytochrome c biogenesis ATPase subunit